MSAKVVDQVVRALLPTYSSIIGRDVRIDYSGCKCIVLANELLTDEFSDAEAPVVRRSRYPLERSAIEMRLKILGKSRRRRCCSGH